jgi:hypothetical protein
MSAHFKNIIGALGIMSVALVSCKKEVNWNTDSDFSGFNSYVKIVHASPAFRTIFNNRDSFNVYVGSDKATGTFLTYAATSPVMPSGGSSNYLGYPSGNQLFRFSVHGVTNPDSVSLYSFTKNLEANQRYSLIITDSIKSSNENVQMWLKDNFVDPIPSQYGVRVVHAVHNETSGIDVYSTSRKMNVFTNIPKNSASGFIYLPSGSDTMIIRRTGTTTDIVRYPGTSGTLGTNRRVYTLVYRGSVTGTGTKARTILAYNNL